MTFKQVYLLGVRIVIGKFDERTGLFKGSNTISSYFLINCYDIRSENFVALQGSKVVRRLPLKASNHDELVEYVKTYFPNFVF